MPAPLSQSSLLASGTHAAAGAATLGGASTIADWIWERWLTDGAILPAVVHGALFFVLLAVVLAAGERDRGFWRKLLLSLPVLGFALAAAFYPIAIAIGYLPALLVTWVGMWLGVALLLRWARPTPTALVTALLRGTIAALLSGVAFWAVSGMWTNPTAAPEPLSLQRFGSWTFAFFPGLAAVLLRRD